MVDDSISTIGSNKDYILVMGIHNSTDPKHIANLYYRLVNLAYENSDLFSNNTN